RPGTALDHADRELVVELPVDDPLRGAVDQVRALGIQHPDLLVGTGAGLLDHREPADQIRIDRDRPLGDREVLLGTQRVHAVIGLGGNLDAADGVGLSAGQGRRVSGHVTSSWVVASGMRGMPSVYAYDLGGFREKASSRSAGDNLAI